MALPSLDAMAPILSVTIPFFALVLCGYLAARFKLLPESAIPGLNIYVLFFALPCLLYRFGASLPVAQLIDASVIAVWLSAALVMVFGTIALTRSPRVGREGRGVRRADRRVPQHRLHGRADAGGAARTRPPPAR